MKVFDENDIQVWHGDCLEVMPLVAADVLLTDPPYGISVNSTQEKTAGKRSINGAAEKTHYPKVKEWDSEIPDKVCFDVCLSVTKNQIIFGGNYFAHQLPPSSCWLVWDKDNPTTKFADCELIWTSFSTAVRKIRWRWNGMLQENMGNKDERVHPTQKPIGVVSWLIENYIKEGETILDPFAGSGTTGIAAYRLKRKCILIEKEQKYIDIICERLTREMAQGRLF